MSRFTTARRLAVGSVAALLLSGVAVVLSAGVASAHAPAIVAATNGGENCTTHNPCGSKKGHLPGQFVPPIDLVATTSPGSITLTWVPTQEYFVVDLPENGSYTCTLLYGYNDPSTFIQTTTGDSCTFSGLSANTNYGVSVDYGTFPRVSATASAYATTPPNLTSSASTSSSSGSSTKKTPALRAPVILSIGGKAVVGGTQLLTVHGSKFYGHVSVWSNSSAVVATVRSVSAKTVVVSVKASASAKPGTYTLTVVDPNQASTSASFTLK